MGENEIAIIYGGTATPASKTKLKQVERQVNSTQPSDKRLKWLEVLIQFDIRDHPLNLYDGPLLLLILKPYIGNYKVGRTLIDSGSGLNLLFTNTYDNLGLPRKRLLPGKEPFYGIMPGMSAYPLGIIDLQVTIQEGENLMSEFLIFKVADFESMYNCILGRPFLKNFFLFPLVVFSFGAGVFSGWICPCSSCAPTIAYFWVDFSQISTYLRADSSLVLAGVGVGAWEFLVLSPSLSLRFMLLRIIPIEELT